MSNEELINKKTDEDYFGISIINMSFRKLIIIITVKEIQNNLRYLEENFGIGSPTAVEFTPLLKKHVDALVGEYLGTPILPKISCKDSGTISNITREKQLQITREQ